MMIRANHVESEPKREEGEHDPQESIRRRQYMTATSVNYEKSHLGQKWHDGYDGPRLADELKALPEPIDVSDSGINLMSDQDDLDALVTEVVDLDDLIGGVAASHDAAFLEYKSPSIQLPLGLGKVEDDVVAPLDHRGLEVSYIWFPFLELHALD